MGAGWYWMFVFTGFALQQLIALGINVWIERWAHQYDILDRDALSPEQSCDVNATFYLGNYAVLVAAYALITFIRDAATFYGSLGASSKLYRRLLSSIFHAKLSFFDRIPLGQVVNRSSKDVSILDQQIAPFAVNFLQLLGSVSTIIVLIWVTLPTFTFVAILIFLAYYGVMVVYANSSRDLKRIESVERSPLLQQLGETVSGCVSIRAYGQTAFFTSQNRRLVDRVNTPQILQRASKAWLTFRVGLLSSFVQFLTSAFVLWKVGSIEPGIAGLVLTYAATFTENVMWIVQLYAIIQQNFNSAERILEYTEIEQEPTSPLKLYSQVVPRAWPSEGAVRFCNYSTRYAPELDTVLEDITFQAKPGHRVTIVGRTGSSKSTLTLALIRALEADNGHITIDDVDIVSVTLESLRQSVSIVAQDPMLFSGSIRDNLDPLHQHSNEEMMQVLRAVRFRTHLDKNLSESDSQSANSQRNHPSLDYNASSLSRGQRQVLCIARALLRQTRILILDEATASIDHAANEQIQAGIRASVANGTPVLTIAHRLLTIADYDSIVVLDAGRVVEQGSVRELLGEGKQESAFKKMCEASGDMEAIEQAAGGSPLLPM